MKSIPVRCARPPIAALLVLTLLLSPTLAHAGDVRLSLGTGGEASTWRGDGAAFGSVAIGYRFADLVAPYFLVRVGYGVIDTRMLTLLSLGGQIWGRIGRVRPYLRLALVHQHEESMSAVRNDAFGAMFGVGDGIRHRGGFEGGLGAEIPLYRAKAWGFHAVLEGLVTGFPDARGPAVYGGGTAGLAVDYRL